MSGVLGRLHSALLDLTRAEAPGRNAYRPDVKPAELVSKSRRPAFSSQA
jgi:hypothetical protein